MQKSTCLLSSLLISLVLVVSSCDDGELIEIHFSQSPQPETIEEVYIGGAVQVPGIYPLLPGDAIEDLISAAGGFTSNTTTRRCLLLFPEDESLESQQRVDMNRAPSWMLEALPGVGEVTAEKIIDYRDKNGTFRHINEILNVDGIGQATLDNISAKITVTDFGG